MMSPEHRKSDAHFVELMQKKQEELQEISNRRVRILEMSLGERDQQINEMEHRFARLKEDFEYNLTLIEGRDEELEKYDRTFAELKEILQAKDTEISNLAMRCDDLAAQERKHRDAKQRIEAYYEEKIKDMKVMFENTKWETEEFNRKERKSYEAILLDAEAKLREKDEQIEIQRRELTSTFDKMNKLKHVEHKDKIDALSARCREAETTADSRSHQLRDLEAKVADMSQSMEEKQYKLESLMTQNKELEAALDDTQKQKDHQIRKLLEEKQHMDKHHIAILDEYEHKMSRLTEALHALEKSFEQQKEEYRKETENMQKHLTEEHQSNVKRWESRIATMSAKLHDTETFLGSSQVTCETLRSDFQDRTAELERQQKELQSRYDTLQNESSINISDLRQRIRELEQSNSQLSDRLFSTASELAESRRDLASCQETVSTMRKRNETLQIQLTDAQQEMDTLERTTRKHSEKTSTIQESERTRREKDRLEASNAELKLQLEKLEAKNKALQSEIENIHNEKEAQRERLVVDALDSNSYESDLEIPSPLASLGNMSPTVPAQVKFHQQQQAEWQLEKETLQKENAKLVDALKAMRAGMEALTMEMATEESPTMVEKADQAIQTATNDKEATQTSLHETALALAATPPANPNTLEEQNAKLVEYVSVLQSSSKETPAECSLLRKLMRIQAEHIQRQAAALRSITSGEMDISTMMLQKQNENLLKIVTDTTEKLRMAWEERDQLSELVNRLRSDLRKAGEGTATQEQLRQVEQDVAERFQHKIRSIESALEQLVEQNRQLKVQVREAKRVHEQERDTRREATREASSRVDPETKNTPELAEQVKDTRTSASPQREKLAQARNRLKVANQQLKQTSDTTKNGTLSGRPEPKPTEKDGVVMVGSRKIRNYSSRA